MAFRCYKTWKFRNRSEWFRNFLAKFPENSKSVEFPKCEQLNRKFRKSQEQIRMELKLPRRKFPSTLRGRPLFRKCHFPFSIQPKFLQSRIGRVGHLKAAKYVKFPVSTIWLCGRMLLSVLPHEFVSKLQETAAKPSMIL